MIEALIELARSAIRNDHDAAEREQADPEEWPFMPLDPRPITDAPAVGWWVWVIPEKVTHSRFHRVASAESLDDPDEGPTMVIEAACGLVWPLEAIAAAVPWHHPALEREEDGTGARCRNCESGDPGRKRRSTVWGRRLALHRSALTCPSPGHG